MRITLEGLHLYLLDKGFIEPASLLDGDYMACQAQTRNIIFRVTRWGAKSLFVKQLNSFDPGNSYVLQKDATCQWLIKNHPAFAELAGYVPDYFGLDPEKQVLVTEYLPEALNLEDYLRQQQGHFPLPLREALATLLASYHFPLGPDVLHSRAVQFFPRQVPWVLNLGAADTGQQQPQLPANSAPNPALSIASGSPDFWQAAATGRADWQATSLLHGDLKWMNLLVCPAEGGKQFKLIDWEIADIGDPLWDVAGILQGFITNLVFYDPALADEALGVGPGVGLPHLAAAWPLMDHFWQLYRALTTHSPGPDAEAAALTKALRYTGLRLIQTAIEQNPLPTLQPVPTKLLQASHAILTNLPAVIQHFHAAEAAVLA